EIVLPIGSMPYGIAIDPSGRYAYVADSRPYDQKLAGSQGTAGQPMSQVFVIDINPASPAYNHVVNTIHIIYSHPLRDGKMPEVADPKGLVAPTGLRDITVSADGLHVYVAAPNLNFSSKDTNVNHDPDALRSFEHAPGNLIEIS